MLPRLITLGLFAVCGRTLCKSSRCKSRQHGKVREGSILFIASIDDKGAIRGTYVNNAPDTQCIGSPFDLSGQLKGRMIIFYVNFTGCYTVTEWRGVLRGSDLPTHFEAAYPQANGRLKIWKAVDVFVKQQFRNVQRISIAGDDAVQRCH
ncbi:avidin/streptavidin family protein [Bradyrhizobium sp. USDA 10063]